MQSDPVEVALREITTARRLVEVVLAQRDSFDYELAKAALDELGLIIRVLARITAEAVETEPAAQAPASFRIIPDL